MVNVFGDVVDHSCCILDKPGLVYVLLLLLLLLLLFQWLHAYRFSLKRRGSHLYFQLLFFLKSVSNFMMLCFMSIHKVWVFPAGIVSEIMTKVI